MSDALAVVLAVVLVAVNGFFVCIEFSFVASSRTKLDELAEEGRFGARRASKAVGQAAEQLFSAQLGITIASLVLGLIAERTISELLESAFDSAFDVSDGVLRAIGVAIAILLVTFVHTVLGEMVPKAIALTSPETVARLFAPVHSIFVALVRPFIFVLDRLAIPILRVAGVDRRRLGSDAHTPQELVRMLDASRDGGLVEEQEHALLTGAIDFGDLRVRQAMVPRSEVVTVARTSTVGQIEAAVVEHGHSRLPVVGANGTILGFVLSKDLLRLPDESATDTLPLELIRRMHEVSIDRKLEDLLVFMRKNRAHIAWVKGPAGEALGLITLEDVLETLVGEIFDESDRA